MKQLIRLMLAMMVIVMALSASANDVQMATLIHEGQTYVFYDGAISLRTALAAAQSGDEIYLSSGNYEEATIDKAVSIYGAGAWNSEGTEDENVTKMIGYLYINIPDSDENQLHIEGLAMGTLKLNKDITLVQAVIKRSIISNLSLDYGKTKNCSFVQCKIGSISPDKNSESLCFYNSYIDKVGGNSSSADLYFENCFIWECQQSNSRYNIPSTKCTAVNTIIFSTSNSPFSSYRYCLFVYNNTNESQKYNCWNISESDWNELWEDTESSILMPGSTFVYTGNDDTPIGIYGGTYGWVTLPAIPNVYNVQVSPQTTSDGKLQLKFSVKAQK